MSRKELSAPVEATFDASSLRTAISSQHHKGASFLCRVGNKEMSISEALGFAFEGGHITEAEFMDLSKLCASKAREQGIDPTVALIREAVGKAAAFSKFQNPDAAMKAITEMRDEVEESLERQRGHTRKIYLIMCATVATLSLTFGVILGRRGSSGNSVGPGNVAVNSAPAVPGVSGGTGGLPPKEETTTETDVGPEKPVESKKLLVGSSVDKVGIIKELTDWGYEVKEMIALGQRGSFYHVINPKTGEVLKVEDFTVKIGKGGQKYIIGVVVN